MKWSRKGSLKGSILAVFMAALLMVGTAPAITAMEEWCEDDPPVLISTPGGAIVPVYVTTGALGLEHIAAVQMAQISYTVKSIKGGAGTQVAMRVTVANDVFGSGFPTRTTVSTLAWGTGTVYATASGTAGTSMNMTFTLGVG